MNNYRHISVTRQQGVFCLRLKNARLEENEIHQVGDEILDACSEPECRVALSLGPEAPYVLYSVFLAKLVAVRNALFRHGARMVLCDASPNAYSAFEACKLHKEFTFVPDFAAAITHFNEARSDEPRTK
jgi:hypothetical protein